MVLELNNKQKEYIDNKLNSLSKSKFRNSFILNKNMIKYIDEKGLEKIISHAYDFIRKNISPANPKNDGKQTPMKNHPVFIAQHACACCCRGCLEKWHKIPKGRELKENEIDYLVALIIEWLKKKYYEKTGVIL